MTNRPDYAGKIQGLLAKAEDPAATPEEAEAYTAKAETLMVKWGVSDAELDEKRRKGKQTTEKIVEARIDLDGSWARGLIHIGFAVGVGLGTVKVLKSASGRSSMAQNLYLIGYASDVERAKTLFESLQLQALAARDAWWKQYDEKPFMANNQRFLAKRQFLTSFALAVQVRLTETRKGVEKTVSPGTELVLVGRSEKVNDWLHQHHKVGKGRGTNGTSHGQAEGRAAGQQANLQGTQVGTGKAGALK